MIFDFYGKEIKYENYILTWEGQRRPVVLHPTESGCLEVRDRALKWNGYPKLKFLGKDLRFNRFCYCLFNGLKLDDIKRLLICHSCDNRLCVNPDHLRPGTHTFNMAEMIERGRSVNCGRGAQKKGALTEVERAAVIDSDMPYDYLAEVYGVSERTIYRIKEEYAE